MLEHKEHFHGSDLEKIEVVYGIKKEDITSFSANVNPLGISYKLREELSSHIDAITTYPTGTIHPCANVLQNMYTQITGISLQAMARLSLFHLLYRF